MGRFICHTLIFFSFFTHCFAQPKWVKNQVKLSKGLAKSSEASAIELFHTEEVTISKKGKAKTHIRRAIKILNTNGMDFSTLDEHVAPFRKIKKLKGWVISDKGKVHKYSQKHTIEIGTSESIGYYDDSHLLRLTMDESRPGSIVAFEYQVEESEWSNLLQTFEFQRQQPVVYTRFTLLLPKGWKLYSAEWNTEGFVEYKSQDGIHVWTGQNLAYRKEEPLMPSWNYLTRRVEIACYTPDGEGVLQFKNWNSVANWCVKVFSRPGYPDKSVREFTLQLTEPFPEPYQKVKAVAEFVRDEIRYVAVEIDKGRWYPRPAAVTLRNRYGDCKDQTTLMRAMLSSIGIESVPVFDNTTRSVRPMLPSPFQFNHCYVGISAEKLSTDTPLKAISKNWLFFDPTAESIQFGDLPYLLKGGLALVATSMDTALTELPQINSDSYRRRYFAEAQLKSDGSMTANITITDFGNRAQASNYIFRGMSKKERIERLKSSLDGITDPVFSDPLLIIDPDSTSISFRINAESYGKRVADLLLFEPDFFIPHGPEALPSDEREHPIWFGGPQKVEKDISWTFPEEWSIEEPEMHDENSFPGAGYTYGVDLSKNSMQYNMKFEQSGYLLPAEDYGDARKFSQELAALYGMNIVLKKR